MQISARNQLSGKIECIKSGQVNSEVIVKVGDDKITAIITNDGCNSLNLKDGMDAVAIIKASNVMVVKGDCATITARNKLKGEIASIKDGVVNSDIEIKLSGGTIVTAIVTNDSKEELNLKVGDEVIALFKANSVILGV